MPVHVEKRNGKYRIIDSSGHIEKTQNNVARDGGGHATKAEAEAQARAINMHIRRS